MWAGSVVHEPPSITGDGGKTDVSSNYHVAEEKPSGNEWLVALAWLALHDVMIWWVEGKSRSWKTIGDEVDP